MIYEVKRYVDDKGATIVERMPINEEGEGGNPSKFSGMASVTTPHGEMPFEFPFPEEYSLEDCFKNFEKVAEDILTEMQREAQKTIVTPEEAGNIIIP